MNTCFNSFIFIVLKLGLLLCGTLNSGAVNIDQSSKRSSVDIELEDLIHIKVTSVSKKEENMNDAAAAIFVLSNDAIRRSGATSVAEALRMVPGVNVSSVSSNHWAISARGFNNVFANKLLVLIDGRAVYNSIFGGVVWNLQNTMLEDVDRIEVIRGPGATLWGANALNGVINVVTRSAKDTQGGYIYSGAGNINESLFGVRYGGKIKENTYYRIFSSYNSTSEFQLADGSSARDDWQKWHTGFRLDHSPNTDTQLTWQSDVSILDLDAGESDSYNFNTIGRWTYEASGSSNYELQFYYDRFHFNDIQRIRASVDTFDLTFENTYNWSDRNELVWGLGYRFITSAFRDKQPNIRVRKGNIDQNLFSAFFQNEFYAIPDKLHLKAGMKIEHNDFTGIEVQPSVRGILKPTETQTLWAAISKSVRTPSQFEGKDILGFPTGAPIVGPGGGLFEPIQVGYKDPEAEDLWAFELGYRNQPTSWLSVDIATFYNIYRGLIGIENVERFVPGIPLGVAEFPADNTRNSISYGAETSITMIATNSLHFVINYSLAFKRFDKSKSQIITGFDDVLEGTSPQNQITLKTSYDFSEKASLDAQLRYVDTIMNVPAYLTADLKFSYYPTDVLEVSIVGQNLLDSQHPEQFDVPFTTTSEVPLSVYGKVTYHF